jgi:hypothetical protein
MEEHTVHGPAKDLAYKTPWLASRALPHFQGSPEDRRQNLAV